MMTNPYGLTLLARTALCVVACILGGCGNPGIVQLSPDTYMLSRQDNAGIFGNASVMKADVIREANEFAAKQGKVAIPITSNSTRMAPGRFATFEYQFRVVDKDDPEAKRTALTRDPDTIIEKHDTVSSDIRTKDVSEKNPDMYAELIKLDDLRKKGLITDAEFEAQKQKLLQRSK